MQIKKGKAPNGVGDSRELRASAFRFLPAGSPSLALKYNFSYLVDPASFGTLNLELKPCILLTAYPVTGRAISVHGSVDRWDERAVLRFKVITTETLWLIPFPTPLGPRGPVETPPVLYPRSGRPPRAVASCRGGEFRRRGTRSTNLSNHEANRFALSLSGNLNSTSHGYNG